MTLQAFPIINKLTLKTTKTDWHLVSPNSITAESNLKVMRMEEMI